MSFDLFLNTTFAEIGFYTLVTLIASLTRTGYLGKT